MLLFLHFFLLLDTPYLFFSFFYFEENRSAHGAFIYEMGGWPVFFKLPV
jgi:hypothetical protein